MLLLIIYAFLHFTANAEEYHFFIIIGLLFCLLGDIFLMLKKKDLFLYGLIVFLLGHISYLLSIIFNVGLSFSYEIAIPILILFIIVHRVLHLIPTKLKIYTGVYSFVILILLWQAIERANLLISYSSIIFACGVIFFVMSDYLLAYNKFIKKIFLAQVFILGTYYIAQILIVISI